MAVAFLQSEPVKLHQLVRPTKTARRKTKFQKPEAEDPAWVDIMSFDEVVFTVDIKVIHCSSVLTEMLRETMQTMRYKQGENPLIFLPEVNGLILCKVIDWAEHHKNDVHPTFVEDFFSTKFDHWDTWFFGQEAFTVLRQFESIGESFKLYRLIAQSRAWMQQ